MWTKVSICLFLLRIPTSKALIRPLQAAIVFLILSNIILTLLWILQCLPIAAAWDKAIQGNCFSRGQKLRIIFAQAGMIWEYLAAYDSEVRHWRWKVISAASDFAFASYPILILWRIQMKTRTKVGLCCLMSLGVMYIALLNLQVVCRLLITRYRTGACCIVRTVLNYQSIPNDITCTYH